MLRAVVTDARVATRQPLADQSLQARIAPNEPLRHLEVHRQQFLELARHLMSVPALERQTAWHVLTRWILPAVVGHEHPDGAAGITHTALKGFDMTRRLTMVGFDATPATKIAAGRAAIDRTRDAGLILLAADAFGAAAKCIDMTVKYSLTREQFGQPIGAFQGVKHQLADLVCDLEPTRSLWWYAAHAFDHIQDKSERHAALAKAHVTDLFDRVGRYAIELHGGIGFTWEFDLHLWWRRALFDRAFLGEASYHRERAAALAGWVG